MNIYNLRKNFTAFSATQGGEIKGKLAFKTKESQWEGTHYPVIILLSTHSSFNEGVGGDLKMNALLNVIKSHVQGPITVLLADTAHLQTKSLQHQEDIKAAFDDCFHGACIIHERYQHYFQGCKVAYWHAYIGQDESYPASLNFLREAYQKDSAFRLLVDQDAESTYTLERQTKYTDKENFLLKASIDILEQGSCLLVLANKGYRFQFYPGKPYKSLEYLSELLMPKDKRLLWIDVFLTIEKKTNLVTA